jgi:hypothetical protein
MFAGAQPLAILLAASASWLFGALYYGVLGKPWLRALEMSEEQLFGPGGKPSPFPFVFSFLLQVLMAAMLQGVLWHMNSTDLRRALITAALLWVGFIFTTLATNHAYTRRRPMLTVIDGGHWLGVLLIQGALLAWWGVR